MNEIEVIEIARRSAQEEGWPWLGKIKINKSRQFMVFGPIRWKILTNAGCRGANIRIVIDDETGNIMSTGYVPR